MFMTLSNELALYVFLTMLAAVVSLAEAIFVFSKTKIRGRLYFTGFSLCITVWSAIAGLYVMFADLKQQIIWAKVQYLGIAPITILWALFVVRYTDTFRILLRLRYWLFLVPLLTLGVVWTNDFHKLIWSNIYFDTSNSFPIAIFEHGWYYDYVHVPYSYGFVLLSAVVLGFAIRRSQPGQRGWLYSLVAAFLVPFLVVAAYNLDIYRLDLVPIGFALSTLLVLASMRFQNLHKRALVAHHTILNSIDDAVFILNADLELVDLNRAASKMIELSGALGKAVTHYLPNLNNEILAGLKQEQSVEQRYQGRHYNFSLAYITEPKGYALLLAKDISEHVHINSKLERQRTKLEAIVEISEQLRSLDSFEEVYRSATQVVLNMTPADLCTLFYYLPETDELEPQVCHDKFQGYIALGDVKVPRSNALSGQAIEINDTVNFQDSAGVSKVYLLKGKHEAFEDRLPPLELVATPIRNQIAEPIGVLTANIHLAGRNFEPSDIAFFEAVAEACSNALARLHFIAELEAKATAYKELFAEASEQAQELDLLHQVSVSMATDLDLQVIIEKTVLAIAEIAGYEKVCLYLLEHDELVLRHQMGYSSLPQRRDFAEFEAQGLFNREEPVLHYSEQAVSQISDSVAEDHSSLLVPLLHQQMVLGILMIEHRGGLKLEKKDLTWLMQLSRQISMALERARLHEQLSLKEQRFRLITSSMSDMIVLHHPDGRSAYISPSCQSILGYDLKDFDVGSFLELVHPQDRAFLHSSVIAKVMQAESIKPFQYRLQKASGEYIWVETFINFVYTDSGPLKGFVSSTRDITDRKQMQEQMLEGALLYDSLTALPNRTLFMDRLEHALRRQERSNKSFAVLFLDLDRFKVINDSLGHNVGDQLLIETAQRLQACVRTHDTVARLGGDEFALLLDDVDEKVAQTLAERITQALKRPFVIEGYPVMTSASIGITMGDTITDSDELLRSADLAMYHVKTHGKAGHALFTQDMHLQAKETLDLELELRSALQNDEFILHYQPIVDLMTGSIAGFEALIRWHNPSRGLVSPSVFIPIAEEVGLIPSIDDWVLRKATKQVALWNKRLGSSLSISVNLSTKNFALTNIVERIAEILHESQLSASLLKLEITESVLMENADVARFILTKLRDRGVTLQIDDFGTGYSSLGYLHNLPLQSLKMDRSFVQGLSGSQAENAIASSIVALAQSLKLDVVAEGIETLAQLKHIRELGCQFGQGFLFSEALSVELVESTFFTLPDLGIYRDFIDTSKQLEAAVIS